MNEWNWSVALKPYKNWNWFFKYHGIEYKFVYGSFKHNKWLKHEQIMIQLSH